MNYVELPFFTFLKVKNGRETHILNSNFFISYIYRIWIYQEKEEKEQTN